MGRLFRWLGLPEKDRFNPASRFVCIDFLAPELSTFLQLLRNPTTVFFKFPCSGSFVRDSGFEAEKSMSNIAGYEFFWAARQHRERVAVVFGARTQTFREVNERGNRLANALIGLGVRKGERVAVLFNNSPESLDTVVGLAKGGFVYVALNARHTAQEHQAILNDAGAVALIAGPEFEATVLEAAHGVKSLRNVIGHEWNGAARTDYDELLSGASSEEPRVEIGLEEPIRIMYTSGTTGKPKGIVYRGSNARARAENFFSALEYRLGVEDAMVHVGPLTHAAGNYFVPYFVRGARNIVLPRFDPDLLQETIHRERPTHLLLVPTMLIRLLEHLKPEQYDLSSITRINYGTAPMPVDVLRRAVAVFGPVFRGHYGLSEAPQPITVLYPHEHQPDGNELEAGRLASCGRAVKGITLSIQDAEGRELPQGEVGEITIKADGVADIRFWNNPELEKTYLRNGYLLTGDLGRLDEAGYLFIVGRKKDLIITGGFNVYSREVEEALFQHPSVLEAVVFGVPDPEWGESVCACVVPNANGSLTGEAVIEHCKATIAGYKKPRYVEIMTELPKNNSGKVDKNAIRDWFMRERLHKSLEETGGVVASYE